MYLNITATYMLKYVIEIFWLTLSFGKWWMQLWFSKVQWTLSQRGIWNKTVYWAALCRIYEFYCRMLGFCNMTNLGLIWKYKICMHLWTTQELNILQVMDSSIQTHWMWELLYIEHTKCCKKCCVPCLTHILWFSRLYILTTVM